MSYLRLGALILLLSGSAAMAAPEEFQVSLGPVARTNVTKLLAVGRGSVSASLDGNKLSIKGLFSGLASPATDAHLCVGVGIGTLGTCGAEPLTVSQSANGTLSGDLTLTAKQVAALHAGQLYIQINSQKAPTGNLTGWLLPPHPFAGEDVPVAGAGFLPQLDVPQK